MSLKSKLEAVIYAAEEPVTLSQLAALFAAEALERKAEEDAKSTAEAEATDAAEEVSDPLPLPLPEEADPPAPEAAEPEVAEPAADEPASESGAPTADAAPDDPEAEARRAARLREREVKAILRQVLDELIADYAKGDRGVEIREIAGGYRMATKPEYHDAVRVFIKSLKPPMKLSLPALETLAVIAYKQPVTAPEVNEIRGVESAGVLGSLLSRKLIATAGRKQVIGRPILYKTTKEFLLRFGLKDLNELPSMEEFEKIAALELNEPDPVAETEAEPENAEDVGPTTGPDLDEDAPEVPDEPSNEQADTTALEPVAAEPESGKDS
ncbi:MAG TPA: SMC-Scp complex subunit ScpB [Terracidiphilus sp.]|nr:SMC-Scp complex subunit ScpB [Terracidiphilus sp.]